MAESNATHDHIAFTTESVMGARCCTGCGAMVPTLREDAHQAFHDRLQRVEAAAKAKKSKKK